MSKRLRVDWPNCKGRGLCHEVLPEIIDLDEWGYPVITGDVHPDLERRATQAVKTCPQIALRMVKAPR
jgi:ferredoxin